MAQAAVELDKSGRRIREMFGAVAPRYDLLNRLLSGCLDQVWRRLAAASLALPRGAAAVDFCCGTGDQAIAVARRGGRVVAADFCLPMLALAERKYAAGRGARPAGVAGDATSMPLASGRFLGATVAFGLRNVADLDAALAEMARLLAPGGRAAILEFAVPRNRLLRTIYLLYFRRILPLVGRLLSPRGSAYAYLPASVLDFPQRSAFCDRMQRAGFTDPAWRDLTGGIVCLYTGARGT